MSGGNLETGQGYRWNRYVEKPEICNEAGATSLTTSLIGFQQSLLRLYIYIYIYMCVCVCVCVRVYIYIYIYVCVCVYIYIYIYI